MKKIISDKQYKRLDVFLEKKLDISRSKAKKMIDQNHVLINDFSAKPSTSVTEDDVIKYEIIEEEMNLDPVKMDLDIVFEDDFLIVINKPNGLVVHPAPSVKKPTLVNGLLYHFDSLSKDNGIRPGIVHRIDAFTTGLLVVAKDDKTHDFLSKQLEKKTAKRKYVALVHGVILNDSGTIDAPIARDLNDRKKMAVVANGKKALTHFKVLERYDKATLIELTLETGRTHQIRVHMNYIGYPIINDPIYSRRKTIDESGQCLHAKELGFIHPKNDEYVTYEAPIPNCFLNILNLYKRGD